MAYLLKRTFLNEIKPSPKITYNNNTSRTRIISAGKAKLESKSPNQRLVSYFYFRPVTRAQYDFSNVFIIGFSDTRSQCLPKECWLLLENAPPLSSIISPMRVRLTLVHRKNKHSYHLSFVLPNTLAKRILPLCKVGFACPEFSFRTVKSVNPLFLPRKRFNERKIEFYQIVYEP